MAKKNSVNNSSDQFKSDEYFSNRTTSLETYTQYAINGSNTWWLGNNYTFALRLSQGGDATTNNSLYIRHNYNGIQLPRQPAFLASLNLEENFPINSYYYFGKKAATTEIYDQSSNFSPGNGSGTEAIFTAPVTGLYFLTNMVEFYSDGVMGATSYGSFIYTSNRTFFGVSMPTKNRVANFNGYNDTLIYSFGAIMDMDAGDIARFGVYALGPASTDDIVSGYISGCLLG